MVCEQYNPRKLTEKQYQNLKDSLEKFGLAEIPAVNTDNLVLAGHQRLKVLTDLFGKDHAIDVRVPNRKLTDAEAKEYNVRSNKNGKIKEIVVPNGGVVQFGQPIMVIEL